MNRKILWVILMAFSTAYFAGCSGNPKHVTINITTAPPASIAPGGSAQIAATETGTTALIDWSCTPVGACGTFSVSPTSSGQATTYTAPATAVGLVTITATSEATGAPFATVNVTIQANQGVAGNFAFYVTGLDAGQDIYSLAGAVLVNADGTLTGEQDFNDAFDVTSPAGGDMITGGSLSVGSNGVGTLTLVTNNAALGTETFTVNFVNSKHALIIEADGNATSSGSFDLQTLSSTLGGGYAFALTGTGTQGEGVASGGVFTITGSAIAGTLDVNDAIAGPSLGTAFSGGGLGTADAFGRGQITNAPFGVNVVYYIVGAQAMRIIDMDTADEAVGSAYSQGTGTFSNASLGNSVFIDQGNFAESFLYAAVGEIAPSGGNFTGVADINEQGTGAAAFLDAAGIAGTYTIASDGYGSLTINPATLMDVTKLGIYMVDSSVNVNDPNNSVGGGGALIVDLSANVLGVGSLVPQTTGSFSGNYALGLQDFFPGGSIANPPVGSGEADFVGNAAVTATTFAGSGTISDPKMLLNPPANTDSVTFSAPVAADSSNPGRFTITPFTVTITNGAGGTIPYTANVYQASSGQLFWIEDGADGLSSVFGGQIQQESALGAAAAKKVKSH